MNLHKKRREMADGRMEVLDRPKRLKEMSDKEFIITLSHQGEKVTKEKLCRHSLFVGRNSQIR
jgi:hypothetical protein